WFHFFYKEIMSDVSPTSDSGALLATAAKIPGARISIGLHAVYVGTLLLVLTIVASGTGVLVVMRTDPIYVHADTKEKEFWTADLYNWVNLNSGDAGPALPVHRARRLGILGVIIGASSIFYGLFRCLRASLGCRQRIWIMATALCFGVGIVLLLVTPSVA